MDPWIVVASQTTPTVSPSFTNKVRAVIEEGTWRPSLASLCVCKHDNILLLAPLLHFLFPGPAIALQQTCVTSAQPGSDSFLTSVPASRPAGLPPPHSAHMSWLPI